MSVQKIIQEAVNRNPLSMKEALEEELLGRIRLALEAKMEEETELDEALSPEEKKKAKEANRVAGRSASKEGNRDFYHSQFRGKKGAEKTATGVDPIKRSVTMPHAMTKIGKHGHARPDSRPDKTTGKPNRLNSLHRSRNINKLVKGKLPEEAELDEVTKTAMKRAVTYTGADGHSHTKLMPVKRVEKTATGQDKIQENKEEVEQIDEISAAKIGTYIVKARKSEADLDKKIDKSFDDDDTPENKAKRKTLSRTMNNRRWGQGKAMDKLTGNSFAKVPASEK